MLRKYVLEASALRAVKTAVPIVTDVNLTAGGLYRFHLVVQVAKRSPQHDGLQRNAMLAAFAALKDLDQVIVVDDDIDPHDPVEVEYARCDEGRSLARSDPHPWRPRSRVCAGVRSRHADQDGYRRDGAVLRARAVHAACRSPTWPSARVDFHVGTDRRFE